MNTNQWLKGNFEIIEISIKVGIEIRLRLITNSNS